MTVPGYADEIRWGIIGCGDVTEVKSGPALQRIPHSQLVAVMRRDAALAADYARRHQVPRWYADADQLIGDPEVNAVYVATPPASHAVYAIRAQRAGKAVYVEKPMARTFAECCDMLRVQNETGMPLFVAYYRRALPGFQHVKELVEAGAIGAVRLVQVRFLRPLDDVSGGLPWRLRPEISGGGLFFDLAAHTLDYLDFLLGPISSIRANACNLGGAYAAEDTVLASWRHAGGAAGSGSWCYAAPEGQARDEIEIIGREGIIRLSTFEFIPVILENRHGRQEYPHPKPQHVQYPLIANLVAALRGEAEPLSTGASAARTSWVMEQMVAR
ncbi:MAG TPA: Gfo/Idh/MocA family oxidoreductase [bacterium]|nr:Gfo/Idh/MocA family oxidoreductase [bacterium]HPR89504.1 Gfo/Idh/MocA family oxidoreductase [bacterium]